MKIGIAALVLTATAVVAVNAANLTLGNVAVGESALDVVRRLGPPDLVQTGDSGHEWRWYDKGGLDRDLLTDDSIIVSRVRVTRPQAVEGSPAPLVQPSEAPLLEASIGDANKTLRALGAQNLPQANAGVRAWRWRGGVIVAELKDSRVQGLLALDAPSAQRLGYNGEGAAAKPYRAPRIEHFFSTGYPRRAAEEHAGGVVVVRVAVDSHGAVQDVRVIVSSGNPDLDNAEIASIRRSTLRPALCDGVPCDGVLLDREQYVP